MAKRIYKQFEIPVGELTPNSLDDNDVAGGVFGLDLLWWFWGNRKWRVASSLLTLREQVNNLAASRRKDSDGTKGDDKHSRRKSDHNPHVIDRGVGVVTALDITHDPKGGCDCNVVAKSLAKSRDARIKYLIWNRRILSSTKTPWVWREFSGANPHDQHIHISVQHKRDLYDSEDDWVVVVT